MSPISSYFLISVHQQQVDESRLQHLRSYHPVLSIVCCYLAALRLLLPGSSSCINHVSCASVSTLSLWCLHYSLLTFHALQLRFSSVLRLQPKHQSCSRCHLVNLPSDITPTPLHPTCTFSSSLVLRWAFDTRFKPAHIHHLLQFHLPTRLMFLPVFIRLCTDCSSVLSVGITGHTDFISYSHPHLTPICCTTLTFLCFLTQHHRSCLSSIVYFL